MSQYQSFPDAAGDSRTVDKLKALQLPELAGRDFLDVGCNEGFFCGFAMFQGASRAVGIDQSGLFVDRARKRFPQCEFLRRSWDELPSGKFDVILLASALHYAEDQPALIGRLIDSLADDGLLVLELGIASSTNAEWIKVERGIDERLFPSMPMVREMLSPYVWKWMGPSIRQEGDPVARHVVHVSRRRPVAYLLMEPPGFGKSSLAEELFGKSLLPVVSGDHQINRAARGEVETSDALKSVLSEGYSPFRIDQATQRLFDRGFGGEIVDLWLTSASVETGVDIAVDAYVPLGFHREVADAFSARGYMPVQLQWDRPGLAPLPEALAAQRADSFYMSLLSPDTATGALDFTTEPTGFIDDVSMRDGRICVRGWAIDAAGRLPKQFEIRIPGRTFKVEDAKVEMRLDVQQHLSLPHALVGFLVNVDAGNAKSAWEIRNKFKMSGPDGVRFQLSGPADAVFQGNTRSA